MIYQIEIKNFKQMKVIINTLIACCLSILALGLTINAQTGYHSHNDIINKLENLAASNPGTCELDVIGKSYSGKDICVLTIGTGKHNNKPGMAIIGGIDGRYPLSREIALGFAEKLLSDQGNEKYKDLLNDITFYIIPDASPDASGGLFSDPVYERMVNGHITDNDRDFQNDEDPYEDLNGDGLITLMRVKDPRGDHITDPADERLMKKADLAKGETGSWFVYTEGIDNDNDDKFNEDGPGGVNFNHNFSFEYEEFGKYAGIHAVSESETRAIADFLYDHFNIYSVFSFGPQDNLGKSFKANNRSEGRGGRGSRIIKNIYKEDQLLNELLSEKYHDITAYKGSPGFVREPGNFMEWAYYHYGRYSYSTPGWWYESENGKRDESSFMEYADNNNYNDVFAEWQEIGHPDFPGKKVEVGGIKPFKMLNPPESILENVVEKNCDFLVEAAGLHPEIELINLRTENPGKDITRITVNLHNKGVFATSCKHGERSKWNKKIRIEIRSDSDFSLISGKKIYFIDRIPGDGSEEYSWLISGKGNFTISAGAAHTNNATISFNIK